LIQKIREGTNSYWVRSKAFRVILITAFFLVIAVPIFLFAIYARILFGISFLILLVIVRLVFGYIVHKEGYVEKAKELSPKYYYYARRVECIVGGGLFTGFAILTTLRVLLGPLPYPHSFLLFLALIVVGAYVGDKVERKLKIY